MLEDEKPIITQADRDMVANACMRLIEHFDSVQIFVSKFDGASGKTSGLDNGMGNWYARYGQVDDWVVKQQDADEN